MRNFLMTIDSAYEESAFIDGASYLIYLNSESKVVLQTLLRRLERAWEQEATDALDMFLSTYAAKVPSEAAKAAMIVITIIALYPFLQRYFIKGIFLGSLKG